MNKEVFDAEIRDLVARRDIYSALCRYMRGQDRLMPDLQPSAFHDDAYVDSGLFRGDAAGFVAFAQDALRNMISTHHQMGQTDIRVEGEAAYGEVYFVAQHRIAEGHGMIDLFIAGRYVDEYRRRDSSWRIFKRRLVIDWVRSGPASDDFISKNRPLNIGKRGLEDFSLTRQWPIENHAPTPD